MKSVDFKEHHLIHHFSSVPLQQIPDTFVNLNWWLVAGSYICDVHILGLYLNTEQAMNAATREIL